MSGKVVTITEDVLNALTKDRMSAFAKFWSTVRGTAVVFGLFALCVLGGICFILYLIGKPASDAAWGFYGAAVGWLAREAAGFVNIATLRADERKPQMDVETALAFTRIVADSRPDALRDEGLTRRLENFSQVASPGKPGQTSLPIDKETGQ